MGLCLTQVKGIRTLGSGKKTDFSRDITSRGQQHALHGGQREGFGGGGGPRAQTWRRAATGGDVFSTDTMETLPR